jgi:uncharacterized membrane protein (UPF0136 family)
MTWLKIVVALYAILNIGGGVEGFMRANSKASLISGCAAGALLLLGLFLAGSHQKLGFGICAVVALGDLGFFTMRFMKGKGLWPAGVMVAASVLVLGCLIGGHFMGRGQIKGATETPRT